MSLDAFRLLSSRRRSSCGWYSFFGRVFPHHTPIPSTYEQSSRMVEPSLELAACKPMSVLMVRALCRELVKCMGTARDGGLGVAAPPGHVTANTCVTVITV